jgi:hypothetical protein
MAPGESRAKKGNQATQSRITWFREEHNLCGDCCNFWGNAFTLFSGFFGAKLQKTSRCLQPERNTAVARLQRALEYHCKAKRRDWKRTASPDSSYSSGGFLLPLEPSLTQYSVRSCARTSPRLVIIGALLLVIATLIASIRRLETVTYSNRNEILHSSCRNNLHFRRRYENGGYVAFVKTVILKVLILNLLHLPMIQSDERWSGICL